MEVGQKVRVIRFRDRVSVPLAQKLGQVGRVQDFKMTDGSGVGVLIRFDDQTATWFFDDEVEAVQ